MSAIVRESPHRYFYVDSHVSISSKLFFSVYSASSISFLWNVIPKNFGPMYLLKTVPAHPHLVYVWCQSRYWSTFARFLGSLGYRESSHFLVSCRYQSIEWLSFSTKSLSFIDGTCIIGLIFLYSSVLCSALANQVCTISYGIPVMMQNATRALEGYDPQSMYNLTLESSIVNWFKMSDTFM